MALLELVPLVRRPRRLAAWSLAIAIAPLAAACDNDDTPSGEPPTDSCGASCDDEDVCTEDRCDAESGQCVHIPRDAANACTMDRHCDDGDPCTTDTCGVDACGFDRCQHELLPGCRSCAGGMSCDDGNACTTDLCGDDRLCTYVTEPLCDWHCSTWPAATLGSVPIGAVTVLGRAEPRGGASCVTGCECEHDLVLTNDWATITLDGDAESPWSCSVATCSAPAAIACDPLERGREYLVWGTGSADRDAAGAAPQADTSSFPSDVGVPPFQAASRLAAEGYCMAPTVQGLFGSYAATLAVDGESPRSFRVEIDQFTQQIRIPPSDGILEQLIWISLDGTSLEFSFSVGELWLTAHLFPSTDRLQGPVLDPNQSADEAKPAFPGDVPEPPQRSGKRIGTMVLVLER